MIKHKICLFFIEIYSLHKFKPMIFTNLKSISINHTNTGYFIETKFFKLIYCDFHRTISILWWLRVNTFFSSSYTSTLLWLLQDWLCIKLLTVRQDYWQRLGRQNVTTGLLSILTFTPQYFLPLLQNPRLNIYSVFLGLWFWVSCPFPRGKKEKSNSKKTPEITFFGPKLGLSKIIFFLNV